MSYSSAIFHPPTIGDSTDDANLRKSQRCRGIFSEGSQLAFFLFFSFVLRLVSLVHRVLHAEALHPALQIRVPREKWLHCHLSSAGRAVIGSAAPDTATQDGGGRPCTACPFVYGIQGANIPPCQVREWDGQWGKEGNPNYSDSLHPRDTQTRSLYVLVHSTCYNRIPQTGWIINNRNLFLTVLEVGKSKTRCQYISVSGESPLPGSQLAVFSLCPHLG